ncbi:Rossmann-like and DUF2520 domain-containing protein [uncultured Draconibacterium sp.]|uniref:Rossmann-like and DUF2520 domain-containing protein n=1 Tax=uncultured Draconibacterium sp. TaxID=1573823 RepID=UPI0025E4ED50|nr:Rossmann-like and DUF2520 domain-containing protein [uncultured Draconibacterium sp.]
MNSYKVCFIGAGNVATHLAVELKQLGHEITQVYSRTEEAAKILAYRVNASYTKFPGQITTTADIYFVALKDSALEKVLEEVVLEDKLLVHCSGSLPMGILSKFSANYGVVYPLQTFSKNRAVNFREIPIFVEGNSQSNEKLLFNLSEQLSGLVQVMESQKRKSLHIAAVFACNFANHCYALAAQYLDSKNISFEVLRPLIKETAQKVQELHPKMAQTGPAIRYDENVIDAHLEELNEMPKVRELYNSISKSIFELHQKKE